MSWIPNFARVDRDRAGNVTGVLELLPIWIITPGDHVIARKVAGERCHQVHTATRLKQIRAAQAKFA